MLRSSLGFHTMTLSLPLFSQDAIQLMMDFKKYSQETHSIQMYSDRPGNEVIKFFPTDKGIKWQIQSNVWFNTFKTFFDIINVTINPKLLSGIQDYITAATYDDMETAINNFNLISKRISSILGTFDCYQITRIDYCINFDLAELAPGCNHEIMMNLIKRADIPPHYTEWKSYDPIAHRMKSPPSSFYLTNRSVHINCYSKYIKLQEQSLKNIESRYPPIRQSILDNARNIIRFEVQCKYHKTYTLSRKIKESGNNDHNKYENLLARNTCIDEISNYYKKTIGSGDWYTLQDAIRIIERKDFNCQKKKRLIEALKFVAQCRSLAIAKTAFKDDELKTFKKTLSDLRWLGINPVTIPKEWGIRYIPNLLYTYADKFQEVIFLKEMTGFSAEHLNDLLTNHKKRFREALIRSSPP